MSSPLDLACSSFHEALASAAARDRRDRPWLIVPRAAVRSSEHRAVRYGELFDQAQRVASCLRERGVAVGGRVALLADNSIESCILVFGTLLHGAVLVPLAPPGIWQRAERFRDLLARIVAESDPRLLLLADAKALSGHNLPSSIACVDFATAQRARISAAPPAPSLTASALIQYTSGTTAQPRGVDLSHGNLLHCVNSIGRAFDASADDVGVSWLPHFHDMGLIGSLLFCTFWGMPLVQLTPHTFALRPEAWLWAISRFGGSCSPAPNSAYHVCANKVADQRVQGLDLSRWRMSFNGAELIHPNTISRFTQRFAAHGYRAAAMYPVYGLAENTVAATLPEYGVGARVDQVAADALEAEDRATSATEGDSGARAFVGVGRSLPGQALRIVEPTSGRELPERGVGEIQLRGPCMMRGYFGREPSEGFSGDGWLRTGDRGYLVDGELFVVGRYKHVVKRAGKLLDCALIENVLRTLPGVRAGAIAVFGSSDADSGGEQLIVVVETAQVSEPARTALVRAIGDTLREESLPIPDRIELAGPGTIPRTSSGKVRHAHALPALMAKRV